MHFEYGTITHYGAGFQQLFLYIHFVTFLVKRDSLPYNPGASWRIQRYDKSFCHILHDAPVWAVPFSLAATWGML